MKNEFSETVSAAGETIAAVLAFSPVSGAPFVLLDTVRGASRRVRRLNLARVPSAADVSAFEWLAVWRLFGAVQNSAPVSVVAGLLWWLSALYPLYH